MMTIEDILDKKSRQFQRKGWNGNGSRMLAAACWVAEIKRGRCKRKFVERDVFGLFVIICLVMKYSSNSIILLLTTALSISYGMKKLLTKHDLHKVLEDLNGPTQKFLVLKLMDFCEAENINPESLEDISKHLDLDTPACDEIFKISLDFINCETAYYVL